MTDGMIEKRRRYKDVKEYKGIFWERNEKNPMQVRFIHVAWGVQKPTEDMIFDKRAELERESKSRHPDNVVTTFIGSVGEEFRRLSPLKVKKEGNAGPIKK